MKLRRIVIMLDGSDADALLLRQGLELCKACGASLDALFVRRNLTSGGDFLGDSFSTYGMEAVLESLADAAAEASANAHTAFNGAADIATGDTLGKFIEHIGFPEEAIAAEGRVCDLIVMAKPEARAASHQLHSISMAAGKSGRPVLLLPPGRDPGAGFKRIVIAWDGSLEAMRATIGAMPLLQAAQSVSILMVDGDSGAAGLLASMANYLGLHGVSATTHSLDPEGRSVAATLIEAATAGEADLLVMGGFGAPLLVRAIGRDETTALIEGTSFALLLAH
jgi:nucleotide-binding universal stress UspA family protein